MAFGFSNTKPRPIKLSLKSIWTPRANPLVVQSGTGRVIGGNGRLVAMKELGWTECDIVELDVDDLQATALGIALNSTMNSSVCAMGSPARL